MGISAHIKAAEATKLSAVWLLAISLCAGGCTAARPGSSIAASDVPPSPKTDVRLASATSDDSPPAPEPVPAAEPEVPTENPPPITDDIPAVLPEAELDLEEVIQSVYETFPLYYAALQERQIAAGENLAAFGALDTKIKGASENGPLGFYETYRHSIGATQPLYSGGELFGGYRIGRGDFQPWYLERQTNEGGELKAGMALPLARNVDIDARRAQILRTRLGQQRAEPEIRLQLIDFVREASYAYWDWAAAGRLRDVAASLLQFAEDRNEAIRRKVETGDTDPPVLQDNRRLIVSREAKLIDAERKLQQTAIKLSLFLRDEAGYPLIPAASLLPGFAAPIAPDSTRRAADTEVALANRPELTSLRLLRQQLDVDYAEAANDLLPDLQAVVAVSQDMGEPTSSKRDKSPLELDAGLLLDVPLQRRKGRGKMAAISGKSRQVMLKTRMIEDKIAAEVDAVYVALIAAFEQVERAQESVELAIRLAEIERRKFELGESDLLSLNLREQQAAEAQVMEVEALYNYYRALVDYRAVLGLEGF